MLRFLRTIKRRLLAENKVTRYLAYAVGEIVLIVIGILIALYINNWNIERINKEKEQFYLSGLKTEFETSKQKLETLIKVNRQTLEESRKIAAISNSSQPADEKELSMRLFRAFSYEIEYNPNNSMLNEIISSGGMKTLSDADLRRHLSAWESRIKGINRQEQSLRAQRETLVNLTANEGGNIRHIFEGAGLVEQLKLDAGKIKADNLRLIRTPKFENNLLLFILTAQITEETHYQPLLTEIETIIQLIEQAQTD